MTERNVEFDDRESTQELNRRPPKRDKRSWNPLSRPRLKWFIIGWATGWIVGFMILIGIALFVGP